MTSRQERLDQAAMHVNGATTEQREDAAPAHEDFYAWGGALDEITIRLAHACKVLSEQIGAYGDNRILRDDEDMDPGERTHRAQSIPAATTWRRSLVMLVSNEPSIAVTRASTAVSRASISWSDGSGAQESGAAMGARGYRSTRRELDAWSEARIVARWRRSPANELGHVRRMAVTSSPSWPSSEPVLEPLDLDALMDTWPLATVSAL